MALAQLIERMSGAMRQIAADNQVLFNVCVDEIAVALHEADVHTNLVCNMRNNISNWITVDDNRYIKQATIFNELRKILDSGTPSFNPKKGENCVVMFLGLQGSGKTKACNQYALYHQNKGWRPALVSADIFRGRAFDQLMQSLAEANIPHYKTANYMETDPATVALEGVENFKKQDCDLIIVDTPESHTIEEMRQFFEAVVVQKPDLVIFVMDGIIGRAAFHQAQAFKQSFANGAVILTNIHAHANGVGALSGVAATKSPVIFIKTGEHLDEFQEFDCVQFASQLLGLSEMFGIKEAYVNRRQPNLPSKEFSLRSTLELLKLDNDQVFSHLRSTANGGHEKVKRMRTILGSMTNEELDSCDPNLLSSTRIMGIADVSGYSVTEVDEVLEIHKRLAKVSSIRLQQL